MPHNSSAKLKPFVIGENKTILLSLASLSGAFDLTGATVFFTVKRDVCDSKALIAKSSNVVTEIEILLPQSDPPNKGKAKIFILPSDVNVSPGDVVVDAWIITILGKKIRVVATLSSEIVRSVTTDFS